jgi:hypothetical protein
MPPMPSCSGWLQPVLAALLKMCPPAQQRSQKGNGGWMGSESSRGAMGSHVAARIACCSCQSGICTAWYPCVGSASTRPSAYSSWGSSWLAITEARWGGWGERVTGHLDTPGAGSWPHPCHAAAYGERVMASIPRLSRPSTAALGRVGMPGLHLSPINLHSLPEERGKRERS